MIHCHICGKNASTGWIKGYTPAPDSQKLALCVAHDTPENRLIVSNAWIAQHEDAIAKLTDVARHKAAPAMQMVSVQFSGGGMLTFTCTACIPTEQGTLRIDEIHGVSTFIPLQHIREYTVRPYAASSE